MFITSRESVAINDNLSTEGFAGLTLRLWRSPFFFSGGKLRVERVISRLIPAGQERTSGFILFSRCIAGPKPVLVAQNPKILSQESAEPQVIVVLMHKAHYFVGAVTKDMGMSYWGTRYLPLDTGL